MCPEQTSGTDIWSGIGGWKSTTVWTPVACRAYCWDATACRREDSAMQAAFLMGVYILTTFVVQFIGFLISRLVDFEFPTMGLMTFLVLYLGAFGLAWPIAVR